MIRTEPSLLEVQIAALMANEDYQPLKAEEIAAQLQKEESAVQSALEDLCLRGWTVALGQKGFCLAADAGVFTGKIQFRSQGAACVFPDPQPYHELPDCIWIEATQTDVALHGDHVLISLARTPGWARRKQKRKTEGEPEELYGQVLRVLRRSRHYLVGPYQPKSAFIVPNDPRFPQKVYIKKRETSTEPQENDLVLVRLDPWTRAEKPLSGVIEKALGSPHQPATRLQSILEKYQLCATFSDSVQQQALQIPSQLSPAHLKGRLDLRNLLCLTIDPEDSQDFDDALTLESLPHGGHRVGVHIADVSYYVKPNTPLDKEAQRRGNSTYLSGYVVPMLPLELSAGICSLLEDQDRLTKSVLLEFSPKGAILGIQFTNTVIRSSKRLTYPQAYALLREATPKAALKVAPPQPRSTPFTGKPLQSLPPQALAEIQNTVKQLWQIASILRQQRMDQGSLDLDLAEVHVGLDAQGHVENLSLRPNDESHQLVEEFMLAANQAVAEALRTHRPEALYRTHAEPSSRKLQQLRQTLQTMGLKGLRLNGPSALKGVLEKINALPQSYLMKIQVLRSLNAACYQALPKGHFGLGKKDYTHFTSPIRRYVDLVVHRLLEEVLNLQTASPRPSSQRKKGGYTRDQLMHIAQACNLTEQNSAEAEREMLKWQRLLFFERILKQQPQSCFSARIIEVKKQGFWLELTDSLTYGFLSFQNMQGELFTLHGGATTPCGLGVQSGRRLKAGDTLSVRVASVDLGRWQIDFAECRSTSAAPQRAGLVRKKPRNKTA